MKRLFLLSVLLVVMCVTTAKAESVVSLNFENWGGAPTDDSSTAGVIDVPYWNDTWLDNEKNSPMTDLRDNSGASTTIDVAWASGGNWGLNLDNDTGSDTDGRRNVAIMKGYIDANDNQTPNTCTVDITEIPFSTYHIYAYFMSDVQSRPGTITDGTTTYHFLADTESVHFNEDPLAADYVEFKEVDTTDAENAVNGNYVVFRGLTGPTQQIVSYIAQGGGITAIQVVEDAFQPSVTPGNEDGSVGSAVSTTQAEVTLNWNALSSDDYPVDPAILGHNIYLSTGDEDDPNAYLIDYVPQDHDEDPLLTDPINKYGPLTLERGVEYYWKIEEVMDDGADGYPAGSPENIMSPVWSFLVVEASAKINSVTPGYNVVDAGIDLELSVSGVAIDTYQWYKIGETEDVMLVNDDINYSGVDTDTLTIIDVQESDQGDYYCIVSNSLPSSSSNRDTGAAFVMLKQLVHHYPFETVDENNMTPDIASGFDAELMQDAESAGIPLISDVDPIVGMACLDLDNADFEEDPNGQYVKLPEGIVDYEDLTISVWYKQETVQPWTRIVDFGNGTTDYLTLQSSALGTEGPMRFEIKVNDDGQVVNGQVAEPHTGAWHHAAISLNGDTGRLYLDGELISTNTGISHDPLDVGAVLNYIGKSQYEDPEFDGMFDDLKIWNYALSGYDVAQEYMTIAGGSICDRENYDQQNYDVNDDCIIDITDFAAFALRWMEDDNFYPVQ